MLTYWNQVDQSDGVCSRDPEGLEYIETFLVIIM